MAYRPLSDYQLLAHDFDVRDREMLTIDVDPAFDPIRSDPRFAALVARMQFPPPAPKR